MTESLKITGVIDGEPELYSYVRSCEIIFSLQLTNDLPELNKKSGDSIIVHYSSKYITYVRKGDKVEFLGKIMQRHLKNKDEIVIWIEAYQLYNETLQFSFDY